METVKIFISYAKDDYNLMSAVEFCCNQIRQIDFVGKKYNVNVWSDHHLIPGERWKVQIEQRIKDADVILFLLSPNFVKSDFIQNIEIPLAIKRWRESDIGILGIYMDDCDFNHLPIKKIQLVPSNAGRLKAVSTWSKDKQCWASVKDGIQICAYNSISRLPWNKGLSKELPPQLLEKNFEHNAPPALQYLKNQVIRAEARKKAQTEAKKRHEEDERNTALAQVVVIALIILFLYTILNKYL